MNSKIVKRISDKIKTFSINKLEDIDELLNYMHIELTTQAAETIVYSYKLSRNKIRAPYKLHIVCRKKDGVLV